VRHDFGVGAHLPGAVALAHVAIEVDALHDSEFREFRTRYVIMLSDLAE
jgi:hypothetical protein